VSFFRIFFYRRAGALGFLHNVSGVVSCLSNPLFPPLLFFPTLSVSTLLSPNHSSLLPSSPVPSTFDPYPILFSTLLPPADAYTLPRSHIHHPLHPCPAQTPYRVSGPFYGYGTSNGKVFTESSLPVQLPAVVLSYTRPPSLSPTSMIPVVTQEKAMTSEIVNDDDIGSEL
jgi:hypothetical protein